MNYITPQQQYYNNLKYACAVTSQVTVNHSLNCVRDTVLNGTSCHHNYRNHNEEFIFFWFNLFVHFIVFSILNFGEHAILFYQNQ